MLTSLNGRTTPSLCSVKHSPVLNVQFTYFLTYPSPLGYPAKQLDFVCVVEALLIIHYTLSIFLHSKNKYFCSLN